LNLISLETADLSKLPTTNPTLSGTLLSLPTLSLITMLTFSITACWLSSGEKATVARPIGAIEQILTEVVMLAGLI